MFLWEHHWVHLNKVILINFITWSLFSMVFLFLNYIISIKLSQVNEYHYCEQLEKSQIITSFVQLYFDFKSKIKMYNELKIIQYVSWNLFHVLLPINFEHHRILCLLFYNFSHYVNKRKHSTWVQKKID